MKILGETLNNPSSKLAATALLVARVCFSTQMSIFDCSTPPLEFFLLVRLELFCLWADFELICTNRDSHKIPINPAKR